MIPLILIGASFLLIGSIVGTGSPETIEGGNTGSLLPGRNYEIVGTKGKPRLILRAGHSVGLPGMSGGGITEYEWSRDMTIRVARELARDFHILLTHRDTLSQFPQEVATVARFGGPDAVADLQFHLNYAKGKRASGALVAYYGTSAKGGKKLAQTMAQAIRRGIGGGFTYSNDGTVALPAEGFENYTFMVRDVPMVSNILEFFFVSNPEDRARADEDHEKNKLAQEIAAGVLHFAREKGQA